VRFGLSFTVKKIVNSIAFMRSYLKTFLYLRKIVSQVCPSDWFSSGHHFAIFSYRGIELKVRRIEGITSLGHSFGCWPAQSPNRRLNTYNDNSIEFTKLVERELKNKQNYSEIL